MSLIGFGGYTQDANGNLVPTYTIDSVTGEVVAAGGPAMGFYSPEVIPGFNPFNYANARGAQVAAQIVKQALAVIQNTKAAVTVTTTLNQGFLYRQITVAESSSGKSAQFNAGLIEFQAACEGSLVTQQMADQLKTEGFSAD